MEWIVVSSDHKGFVSERSQQKFSPWGFNYDHDDSGRLIEDYWDTEWKTVEEDFDEMKQLGANVVRVHLQFSKFMVSPEKPNSKSLRQLGKLLQVAEKLGLYLDLTGLGCYHKKDVPAWYDDMTDEARWNAQAHFWSAIAKECKSSPAVFCYDLMNEPVVPVGPKPGKDWLGPPFGDEYFVQWIGRETKDRPREAIAKAWIEQLSQAIRKQDKRHLITVGLVNWSLHVPNKLYSGFEPKVVAPGLDFLCIHLYPEKGKLEEDMENLRGFAVGRPVVIEETFPLKCSLPEMTQFLDRSQEVACGWVGFYWGKTAEQYRADKTMVGALMIGWLDFFQKNAGKYGR